MRLLHPRTIEILASHPEFPKNHLSHAWSEVFKYLASGQKHPKMFIQNKYHLGSYLKFIYAKGIEAGCSLDYSKIDKLDREVVSGFYSPTTEFCGKRTEEFESGKYFDSNYLFSDACSLYFKGTNIFPDIFGDEWRKYVPVESLKEIKRQVDKTLSK